MDIDERHAAALCKPVQFSQPDFGRCFAQDEKQCGILRQRVGQFHVAASGRPEVGGGIWPGVRARDPKRKNGARAVRLRLKRIGVERGGIVLNIQFMQPVEFVEHEAGAESGCTPFLQVAVDVPGVFGKFRLRAIKPAIMVKVMNSHFKAVL